MKTYRWAVVLLVLFGLVPTFGCNDEECATCPDDPPEGFEILLTCVDEEGLPLANTVVGAMPALPDSVWPWGPNGGGEKSMTVLQVNLTEALRIRIMIQDVEGNTVQLMEAGVYGPGWQQFGWNGQIGDTYVHSAPGYYEAVLLVDEGEEIGWAAVDSVGMVQAAFDPGQYSLGTTDSEGKLRITDRRLVPAFFELLPLVHVTEDRIIQGEFALTANTWLYCRWLEGEGVWAELEAIDGSQELIVTFSEEVPTYAQPPRGPSHFVPQAKKDSRASLSPPYPNPFN